MPDAVQEKAPQRPGFIQRRWGLCIVLAIINLAIWCYFIAWMFGAWDFWHWQWAVEHGPELASELRQIGRRVFTISAIVASHLGALPLVFLLFCRFIRKGSDEAKEKAPNRAGFIQRRWGVCIVLAIINLAIWCGFIAWMFDVWDFWHWQAAVEFSPEQATEIRQYERRVYTFIAILASHLGSLPLVFLLHYHFIRKGSV